jgi:hypothetical protein
VLLNGWHSFQKKYSVPIMNKWFLYNVVVAFAVYRMSDLILWFPWSINPLPGMTLTLTVSPVIWAFSAFLCIRNFPKKNLWIGAVYYCPWIWKKIGKEKTRS